MSKRLRIKKRKKSQYAFNLEVFEINGDKLVKCSNFNMNQFDATIKGVRLKFD